MSIAPLAQWTRMQQWLTDALRCKVTRIVLSLRYSGQQENLPSLTVDEGDSVASLQAKIEAIIERTTATWEHHPKVAVQLTGFGKDSKRVLPSDGDHFSVNDDTAAEGADGDDTGVGGSEPGNASTLARHHYFRHGVSGRLAEAEANIPQFMVLANLELVDKYAVLCDRTVNRVLNALDAANTRVENMTGQVLEAQLGAKRAEVEADGERAMRGIQNEDRALKRELLSMFGTNLGRAFDLFMAQAAGLPPNDPMLQQQFLMGFVRKNPDRAREIAMSLGLEGGAFALPDDPAKLLPMLKTYCEAHPAQAMELGESLYGTLEDIGRKLDEQKRAAEKKP